jgi:dephospho-CoA kinase
MKVILLSGWSTSGKDTVGKILEKNYKASLFAFADVLKQIVANEYQFPVAWTYTEQGKQTLLSNGKTVREVLIQRGQEIRKEKNDLGYFARIVAQQIQTLSLMANPDQLVVITDWRLPVELETLQTCLNSKIYKIRVQRANLLESPIKDSETETQLDTFAFDRIIMNNGISLENLENEIKNQIKDILLE